MNWVLRNFHRIVESGELASTLWVEENPTLPINLATLANEAYAKIIGEAVTAMIEMAAADGEVWTPDQPVYFFTLVGEDGERSGLGPSIHTTTSGYFTLLQGMAYMSRNFGPARSRRDLMRTF